MLLDTALTRIQYTRDCPANVDPRRWAAILRWVDARVKHNEPIGIMVNDKKPLVLHLCDWNCQDRVLKFDDREPILTILKDGSRPAEKRMEEIYDLATERDGDPRASEMGTADIFVSWPSYMDTEMGWQREVDDSIAEMEL